MAEKAVVSVKGGGNVGVAMIRDLIATIEREGAKIGVILTLEDSTTTMRRDVTAAGLTRVRCMASFNEFKFSRSRIRSGPKAASALDRPERLPQGRTRDLEQTRRSLIVTTSS
ncbi:hypothetical protein [Methylosinus sp. KRF6]|uniref:hypothetical protein n=1 Tax=Methylosinus sp. KRF6 TaxID=2846853 RepID=UPI0035301218